MRVKVHNILIITSREREEELVFREIFAQMRRHLYICSQPNDVSSNMELSK